jgi:hypothetical protein
MLNVYCIGAQRDSTVVGGVTGLFRIGAAGYARMLSGISADRVDPGCSNNAGAASRMGYASRLGPSVSKSDSATESPARLVERHWIVSG